jgi:hypothetical protein
VSLVRFVEVTLAAPPDLVAGLEAFYAGWTGETTLRFRAGAGAPFYHFALLVPGDRFDAAHAWAEERVEILADAETGERIFRTRDEWNSSAIYFHDPAGNIVELIAHHGLEENGRTGAFATEEIVGCSELGVVGDRRDLLRRLEAVGLELFRGTVDEPDRLAFVGEPGRTFILSPPGRGWLPLGRPAEPHPVEAAIELPTGSAGVAF